MNARIEEIDGKYLATLEGEMDTAAALEAEEVLKPIYNSEGKDVIIVEDIVDSGVTLNYLKGYFESRGANSVRVCALLDKPAGRRIDIDVDYIGFTVDDRFIVGYGLDFDQKYRNLPYITYLED